MPFLRIPAQTLVFKNVVYALLEKYADYRHSNIDNSACLYYFIILENVYSSN